MRKPLRVVVVWVVAIGVLVVLAWRSWPAGEPVLRGKSLGAWLEQYYESSAPGTAGDRAQQRQEAASAVKEMGTNAIPALLARVRARDSSVRKRFLSLIRKQSIIKLDLPNDERRRNRADWGFALLGPLGKPAIPDLIALLQNDDSGVRCTAARCLGHIGPDAEVAIPAIMPLLAERDKGLPILAAMDALREIHRKPEVVIPAMVEFLQGNRAEWN